MKILKITVLVLLIITLLSVMIYFIKNDYSFKPTKTKLQYEVSYKLEDVNKINVDIKSIDVNFKKSDNDEFKIKVYSDSKDKITVSNENGILNVKQNNNFNGCKFFCFTIGSNKADIYVPEGYTKDIDLKLTSGDITSEIDNLNNYNIKLTSGDVTLNNVNSIKGKLTSGDVEINSVNSYINLEGTSGDIEIKNISLEKDSKIKITSGDVEIDNADNIYINAHVKSGDIKVRDNNRFADHELEINATSGDIEVR